MKHSASFEQITPEMAKQLLTYNTNNRPVSADHVAYLADEIRQGRFMPTTTIHLAYDVNGNAIMINGQHVSMAIIKANKPVLLNIVRSANCTPEEQVMLYMDTDIARKRTFAHSAVAYHLPQSMNLPSDTVDRIARALRFIANGFGIKEVGRGSRALSDSILFEHVPRWAHEARLIDLVARPMTRQYHTLIRKSPIYSIALVTMFYQPERAKEFWSQVTKDDGLSIGDPRKTLHNYLPKTTRTGYGHAPVPLFVQARATAYCWNAFWEERPLSIVSVAERNSKSPMVLKGTSYSGNQAIDFYPHRDPNHTPQPIQQRQQQLIATN